MVTRVVATVVLATVLLFVVPLSQVTDAITRADPLFVIVGVLLGLLARVASAERTYSISAPMGLSLSRASTIEALFISNFWSLLLPGVAAGTVSTVYRYRRQGVSLGVSVGLLAVSRLVEVVVYCLLTAFVWMLLATTPATGQGPSVLLISAMGVTVVAGLLGIAFLLRIRTPGRAEPHARTSTFRTRLHGIAVTMRSISMRAYAFAAASATLQALLDAASVGAFAKALNISLDMVTAVWVNGVAYLAILLPLSIAGVGARDGAVIAATSGLHVSTAEAVALSVLMLAATIVNALVGGLVQLQSSRASQGIPEIPPLSRHS